MLALITSEFPTSETPAIMRAALLHRAKQPKQCEESLEAAAAAASNPTAALLILAQLQLQAKEPQRALATLQRVTSLKGRAGMVGTLVALHERLGETENAAACFDGATDPAILRAAAAFFSRHGRWSQAAAAHQAALNADPRDLQSLAGLVIATSHYDAALSNEHYARLEVLCPPPEDENVDMVDAAELEQAALPRAAGGGGGSSSADSRKRGSEGAEGEEGGASGRVRKKRRRKKKIIWPKGFDPENPSAFPPPDPERWLPKRERSTYRKSKKDKRAGISRGPQGSATGAARVDVKATTNIQMLSDAEKAKKREEVEAGLRAAAAQEAATAAGRNKKGKGKGKAKF